MIPTPKLSKLGRVDMGIEAVFGTESVAYAYLRCDPLDLTNLNQESIVDTHQRPSLTNAPRIPGLRNGTVTLKGPLYGWKATTPTTAPALTSHPLAKILAVAFGAADAGTTLGTVGGGALWTSAATTLTCEGIAPLAIGSAHKPRKTGVKQVVWTTAHVSATPDTATIIQALTDAGDEVLDGGLTFAQKDDFDGVLSAGVFESFSIKYTDAQGYITSCLGCIPSSVKIMGERGKFASYEIVMTVSKWTVASGGTLATGSWAYPQPEVIDCSGVVCFGADLAVTKPLAKFELDLGLELQPVGDINGCGGVGRYFYSAKNPKLSVTVIRDQTAEVADWNAQTALTVSLSWGSVAGKAFAILVPGGRLIEYPKPGDEDGKLTSSLVIEPQEYTADTGSSTLTDTPLRFAIL